MSSKIQKDIAKAIKKDLPNQVGEQLQELLAQGERDAKAVKDQADQINKRIIEEDKLRKKIDELLELKHRSSGLDSRESDLNDQEDNLKVAMLEVKLEEANKRADMVKDFTSGLVRNTEFKETVFSNSFTNARNTPQGYHDAESSNTDTTTTKTTE